MSLLKEELIYTNMEPNSSDELFNMLSVDLLKKGYINPTWLEAIEKREKTYPTGLEFETVGIAIPHTDPIHIKKPYIALLRLQKPVVFEFMAGGGDPVEAEFVINLGIQHQEDQVEILQKLMGVFANEQYVAELRNAPDEHELYGLLDRYLSE